MAIELVPAESVAEPLTPNVVVTDRLKAAELALDAAMKVHELAVAQAEAERLALDKAKGTAFEAEAAVVACPSAGDASYPGLVRGVQTAQAMVEETGNRLERATLKVAAAADLIRDARLELKQATIEAIDGEIAKETVKLYREFRAAAVKRLDLVHHLRRQADRANKLESELPGYQPPYHGTPSDRGSGLTSVFSAGSSGGILSQAAHYAAQQDQAEHEARELAAREAAQQSHWAELEAAAQLPA
jgi:DNA repair exonuclease SbcCD ATPase subunit